MKRRIFLCLLILFCSVSFSAAATTRYVVPAPAWPNEYSTIQAAIDDSNDHDTVIVTKNVSENINFYGKAIKLRSNDVNNPANTVITGTGNGSVVTIEDVNEHAELKGFTITNGNNTDYGGGIECAYSSLTISNCIITGNNLFKPVPIRRIYRFVRGDETVSSYG